MLAIATAWCALSALGLIFTWRKIRGVEARTDALRSAMRSDLLSAISRLQDEVERLQRELVRREEMVALDARLMACVVSVRWVPRPSADRGSGPTHPPESVAGGG